MQVVFRVEPARVRSGFSFTVSALIHGSVLFWLAVLPLVETAPPARSLYDQEIRPREHTIIWYNLRERIPEIAPAAQTRDPRPTVAKVRAPRHLVSQAPPNARPPQLIWTPAPEIQIQQALPSPNVVAFARPERPVRAFSPPEDKPQTKPTPALPDAPRIAKDEPAAIEFAAARPLKPFAAPEQPQPKITLPEALPEAPRIAAAQSVRIDFAAPARPQPRSFTPPPEKHNQTVVPVLAAAPELTLAMDRRTSEAQSLLPALQPARRTFIPPAEATTARVQQPANLPAAPEVQAVGAADAGALPHVTMARAVRPFAAPAASVSTPAPGAPAVDNAPVVAQASRSDVSMAIVGLFPARSAEVPVPKASQQAGFSAGPQPRPEGGEGNPENRLLVVPGLFAEGKSKDSEPTLSAALVAPTARENLAAVARSLTAGAEKPVASATRLTGAPDPRLAGRLVYTIAIQMPNTTSYSGSWTVWFAERLVIPGEPPPNMQAPSPLRKVDPKYIPAAVADNVEGKVRLAGIIRKDGHVDGVELLRHLDNRLDQSAVEALAKWQFSPALRNGVPVDVDAVFDIPFRLAPKTSK